MPGSATQRQITEAFRGAPHTVEHIKRAALEAQTYYPLRLLAEDVIGHLGSKDYLSEICALYYWVCNNTRYANDPRTVELVRSPREVFSRLQQNVRTLSSMNGRGWKPSLDCLPEDTLLLKRGHQPVPIKHIKAGDQIWGFDRWSTVEATLYKGILPVDAVMLNNGSTFFATPDHLAYVERCPKHPDRDACDCDPPERERVRIRVGDLTDGMQLTTPSRLPFGDGVGDVDRMYVEGLYLSDGWHQKTSFCISGKDGFPKEAQKREVEEICGRLGVKTKWYDKFINVKDKDWALRMQQMGAHAPDKHALTIDLQEGEAAALLRGIMADSGANTNGPGRTFTTTSRELALQTRLLHKMFAASCGERFIANHGGLGKNPIWRLNPRVNNREDGKATKRLRVKRIERAVSEVPVWDIQTDDHYVYLPEADVTVSNCDDLTALLAGLFLSVGREVRIITVAFRNAFYNNQRQYQHVYLQVREPRTMQWIVLDPVAADATGEMLSRVKAVKIWPVA